MSVAAIPQNWTTFDTSVLPINVAVDPAPPASSALLATVNATVQAVAVTPYVATGHLCWRHGYGAGGAATAATRLYFTMSVAPGAVHGKFHSTDRMIYDSKVTPAEHSVWTVSGGAVGAAVTVLPMLLPPGQAGNEPSFWVGQQFPIESSNTIDDTPATSSSRMLEFTAARHPTIEDAFCSAVMSWSCRVVHLSSDLASL